MKVEHFLIIFIILIAVAVVKFQGKVTNLQVMDNKSVEYNRNIDAACDDAMSDMIEVVDDYNYTVNLDSCAESFFNSLYASFGVMDSQTAQEQLKWYLPCLVVTENDGFYVYYHQMSDNKSESKMQWTQKMPYYYSGSVNGKSYVINFTMTDDVIVRYGNRTYKGDWHVIEGEYLQAKDAAFRQLIADLKNEAAYGKAAFMSSEEKFQVVKQAAMQYQITKKTNYYVKKHNVIAKQYGLNYTFSLPVASTDTFARGVNDISLLAIFQGYPYGKGSDDTYSRFAVSGARIMKKQKYYVTFKEGESGIMLYHRGNCPHITDRTRIFDSKEECAAMGAYPCPDCNP